MVSLFISLTWVAKERKGEDKHHAVNALERIRHPLLPQPVKHSPQIRDQQGQPFLQNRPLQQLHQPNADILLIQKLSRAISRLPTQQRAIPFPEVQALGVEEEAPPTLAAQGDQGVRPGAEGEVARGGASRGALDEVPARGEVTEGPEEGKLLRPGVVRGVGGRGPGLQRPDGQEEVEKGEGGKEQHAYSSQGEEGGGHNGGAWE